MPRLYAPNQVHACDWANVPFVAGAAAVASGEDTAVRVTAGGTVDAIAKGNLTLKA